MSTSEKPEGPANETFAVGPGWHGGTLAESARRVGRRVLDWVNPLTGVESSVVIPEATVAGVHRLYEERGAEAAIGRYKRFMPIAVSFAAMSKYPGTKVGSLVLGPGWEVRSSGWNGAPRGSDADVDDRSKDRSVLLDWIAHAEANAITNAARCGTALEGCTLICTHAPCMSCAKLIVQAGIRTVVFNKPDGVFLERWQSEFNKALALFAEVGVAVVEI